MSKPTPSQLRDYAFVNIAKKQLGIVEDDYRAMLQGLTGKTSLTKMDLGERYKVKQRLIKLGFKPTTGKKNKKRYSRESKNKDFFQKTPTDKIIAIWIDASKNKLINDSSESALDKYVQRMTKKKYNSGMGLSSVRFLENAGADIFILEALKQYLNRLGGNY